MNFRHEWKHEISYSDMLAVRQRLRAVAKPDAFAPTGRYEIRSLYLDTPEDKALREKLDGVNRREKFRIRYYNRDASRIFLEKKSRCNGLGSKERAVMTDQEVQALVDEDYGWMRESADALIRELYRKMTVQRLRPRTIVDYTREPFTYGPGNVRVTLDYHIRTGLNCIDFLNPDCVTVPAGEAPIILEVKWDEFLPAVIRDAVQLTGRRAQAFSKYAACRIYG